MSLEEAVTDGLPKPLDTNAQSAEDVKKMLAQLKGEAGVTKAAEEPVETEKTSDVAQEAERSEPAPAEKDEEQKPDKEADSTETNGDREHDRARRRHDRDDGRSSRGGRGGGRGGGFRAKNYKENIKSDLTLLKETDDPVQIRKQVKIDCPHS